MKTDLDSYLYILITIAILIIGALGSRRRKPTGNAAGEPAGGNKPGEPVIPAMQKAREESLPSDPFERLEKLFVPSETTPVFRGELGEDEEPLDVAREIETPEMDFEAETRRVKEMELERKRRKQQEKTEQLAEAFGSGIDDELISEDLTRASKKEKEKLLPSMFDEPEDLKKAIIYSEIFNKREF